MVVAGSVGPADVNKALVSFDVLPRVAHTSNLTSRKWRRGFYPLVSSLKELLSLSDGAGEAILISSSSVDGYG